MGRNDRRRERSHNLGPAASHPMTKRIWANYKKYGDAALEIFTQYDDSNGKPRHFSVFEARMWCSANRSIYLTKLDFDLADAMQETGVVDADHLVTKKCTEDVPPITIFVGASAGSDRMVDGGHRYVAFANDVRAKGLKDQVRGAPAYIVEPSEWKRFVISVAIVKSLSSDKDN